MCFTFSGKARVCGKRIGREAHVTKHQPLSISIYLCTNSTFPMFHICLPLFTVCRLHITSKRSVFSIQLTAQMKHAAKHDGITWSSVTKGQINAETRYEAPTLITRSSHEVVHGSVQATAYQSLLSASLWLWLPKQVSFSMRIPNSQSPKG